MPIRAGAARRAAEVIASVAGDPGQPATCVITLADANRLDHLVNQVGLMPLGVDHVTVALADADALLALMAQDKKVKRGKLTFILLEAVGRAVIANNVEPQPVRDFLQAKLKA